MINYKCGHPASATFLCGKIHPDRAVELLLISQIFPTVDCYSCLKTVYSNPNYVPIGFRSWGIYPNPTSKAYAHLLRHIALMADLKCDSDNSSTNYWIKTVFNLVSNGVK